MKKIRRMSSKQASRDRISKLRADKKMYQDMYRAGVVNRDFHEAAVNSIMARLLTVREREYIL